ncbi:MAG TPA: hypothetical protein VNN07_00565 [Candidatus Tectomicrobia bacterium]|nr:hypothetical protein [Candidatus Tectomicrobia bacterium]
MNAYAVSYPGLQRRLIAARRSRAFFSPRTTRHVRGAVRLRARRRVRAVSPGVEVGRAALALAAFLAWAVVIVFFVA